MGEIRTNIQDNTIDFQNVDITDDFMFAYVMQRPDLCIELIGYLFPGQKIQKIRYLTDDDKAESDTMVVTDNAGIKSYPMTQKNTCGGFW